MTFTKFITRCFKWIYRLQWSLLDPIWFHSILKQEYNECLGLRCLNYEPRKLQMPMPGSHTMWIRVYSAYRSPLSQQHKQWINNITSLIQHFLGQSNNAVISSQGQAWVHSVSLKRKYWMDLWPLSLTRCSVVEIKLKTSNSFVSLLALLDSQTLLHNQLF